MKHIFWSLFSIGWFLKEFNRLNNSLKIHNKLLFWMSICIWEVEKDILLDSHIHRFDHIFIIGSKSRKKHFFVAEKILVFAFSHDCAATWRTGVSSQWRVNRYLFYSSNNVRCQGYIAFWCQISPAFVTTCVGECIQKFQVTKLEPNASCNFFKDTNILNR